MTIDSFLSHNEKIVETKPTSQDGVDYNINFLERSGLPYGDEIILEIRTKAEKCVLIGGNPLELKTLNGIGRLVMIDLESGDRQDVVMSPRVEAIVPSDNTLYWYENDGLEPLVVRDHCDGFNPDNEPSAEDVAQRLTSLLSGQVA